MKNTTAKICTLSREELEKVVEDLWIRASTIQRLTYLLQNDLDFGLSESRARAINDDTVTLMFQRRGIDCTIWLAGEAWSKMVDLLNTLSDLNSDAEAPASRAGDE